MRSILLALALSSVGCSSITTAPEGFQMSFDHRTGMVYYKPAKYIYMPGEPFPISLRKPELAMCMKTHA